MADYQYIEATCWGKGFITHGDSRHISFENYAGNLWKIPNNNQHANRWSAGVAGVKKTLVEAQAIYDADLVVRQNAWDALPDDAPEKDASSSFYWARPTGITLTE